MEQRLELLEDSLETGGSVVILEAPAGSARTRLLRDHLDEARRRGARTWLLNCHFDDGGPWAGIRDLFSQLIAEIRQADPDLIVRHDYELAYVVPEIQRTLQVRNPTLTDLAPPEEKVRNYPADRALRIVHGLIDLLDEWKNPSGTAPWVMACDDFDGVSVIGGRFFRELIRRRGARLRLTLLVAVPPEGDQKVKEVLGDQRFLGPVRADLEAGQTQEIDREAASQIAQELDELIGEDRLRMQMHLPEVLRYARLGQRADLLLKWRFRGLEIYNTMGLYEEARIYGEAVRATLRGQQTPAHKVVRWAMFLKLIMCYLGLGQAEAAYELAREEALGQVEHPVWQSQLCYLVAMLHARYLPVRDLEKAEEYLEAGVRVLDGAELPSERVHFQFAFNRNGLAMVRHFQGRFEEAIALCETCRAHLETHLSPERHRLHRSVLLYNLAQVYSALGQRDKAITHYSAAMEMDPNYSEYYNERGGLLLQQGRLAEAWADYQRAIELSAPYFESFTNLGQCARLLGRMKEAVEAYSRALDLEPRQILALLGRAQAREALNLWEQAIDDYSMVLMLQPDQWEALANRAVLYYQTGRLRESLADLDRALELAPSEADLYQNRGVALEAVGQYEAAAKDLRTYLELRPDAPDAVEVAVKARELEETPCGARPAA